MILILKIIFHIIIYKLQKLTKLNVTLVVVFRTSGSASDSDFRFELKEQLYLPDNTACYVDDISILHTWRTIESHN